MEESNVLGTENTAVEQEERKFTQAEMDKVVADRLVRERKKLPSEDELKAFQDWKKNQQTEAEKQAERDQAFADMQKELNRMRQEKTFLSAGYDAETAAKLAGYIVDGNTEEFVKTQTAWMAEQKKIIYAQTKEELLKATPTVNTGAAAVQDTKSPIIAYAEQKGREENAKKVKQQQILNQFMKG